MMEDNISILTKQSSSYSFLKKVSLIEKEEEDPKLNRVEQCSFDNAVRNVEKASADELT